MFTVGGDDGFRLSINGLEFMGDWSDHSYRTASQTVMLNPGIYELTLDYFELTGQAELSFRVDSDVVQWQEAVSCSGRFVEPPAARFFVYHASGETLDEVANRFGISSQEIPTANAQRGGSILVPGTVATSPKVVLIQGIDSSSGCSEVSDGLARLSGSKKEQRYVGVGLRRPVERMPDNLFFRRHTLLRAIQTRLGEQGGQASLVDDADVLAFSYSGNYRGCVRDKGYTVDSFVIPERPSSQIVPITFTSPLTPEYTPKDTCSGVEAAAQELETFINRILVLEPDSRFVLVGHSLGGMVAAYFVSQQDRDFVSENIQAVVTLDSPLLGHPFDNPLSTCRAGDAAWQGILGHTDVVGTIEGIGQPEALSLFLTINSSTIGDTLPVLGPFGLIAVRRLG